MSATDADEPSEETLAPDESPTPLWLPMLGAGLFLLALLWFVATRDTAEAPEQGEAPPTEQADEGEANAEEPARPAE